MRQAIAVGLIVIAASIGTSGCGSLTAPCVEETQVVEVMNGLTYDFGIALLEGYRSSGWICRSDGAIRNAFGGAVGTRYVCTRCR